MVLLANVRAGPVQKLRSTDTLHGVYLPYWTFDAHVHAAWTAMAGHVYFENVQRRGSDGRLVNVAEQRVRWEPAAGEVEHFFDDDPVPGTMGSNSPFSAKWNLFPTRGDELKPYEPDLPAGMDCRTLPGRPAESGRTQSCANGRRHEATLRQTGAWRYSA